MANLKTDMEAVQHNLISTIQKISRITMSDKISTEQINKQMDDYLCDIENVCIESRQVVERYRPIEAIGDTGKPQKAITEIVGSIDLTCEGWVHITLKTLIPHCKFKTSGYLHDTLMRLLDNFDFELPMFDTAFLAIVEHCNHNNRNAFDNDNKGWKMIPNALKGRVFEDDDQFHLSIGLFSKICNETACHIYVTPMDEAPEFMYSMCNDLL